MDIIKSTKRGRPSTGRAYDGSLFMRMPKDKVEAAKSLVKREILGDAGVDPTEQSKGLESKGMAFGEASGQEISMLKREVDVLKEEVGRYKGAASFKELADVKTPPITKDHLPLLKRIMELESQLSQMTASYEVEFKRAAALEGEVGLFEKRREAWLRATDDQKTAYWRDRALRNEAMINQKKNEYDQESG